MLPKNLAKKTRNYGLALQDPHSGPFAGSGQALRPFQGRGVLPRRNRVIRVRMGRAVKTTSRWKSRKAEERALRYIFFEQGVAQTCFEGLRFVP